MKNIFEMFRFNNVCYSDLRDESEKKEIEFWAKKLDGTDVGKLILSDYPDMYIYLNTDGMLSGDMKCKIIGKDLPDDLLTRIINTVHYDK